MKEMVLKVAHVLPTLSIGGLWRQAYYLSFFARESFEMIVVNVFKGHSGPEFPLPNTKVISLSRDVHEHYQRSSIISQLCDLFRRENIDIVHSYHYFTDIYTLPAAYESGINGVVRSVNGILQASPIDSFRKTFIKYDWTVDEIKEELSLEKYCRFTICVSKELKRKLIKYGISKNKILIMHNCVDANYFSPNSKIRDNYQIKNELGIKQNSVVIGFIGRFELCKNPLALLEICKELLEYSKNFLFLMIGEGPLLNALLEEIKKKEISAHFSIIGPNAAIKQLLSAMDILFIPSLTEGFPNIILEGMSMGIPVIASAVGAVPEIITHGSDGFIFDVHDIQTATELLISLICRSSYRKEIGSEGRKTILKRFQISRKIQKLSRLYEKIYSEG